MNSLDSMSDMLMVEQLPLKAGDAAVSCAIED